MTKSVLKECLKNGYCMDDLFDFTPGQECMIYKSDSVCAGEEIIYIPDIALNQLPVDTPIADEANIEEAVSLCYTGRDFLEECGGNTELAMRLFYYCDWQHPSSALPEVDDDED